MHFIQHMPKYIFVDCLWTYGGGPWKNPPTGQTLDLANLSGFLWD